MLRWLPLALVLAASHATFADPSLESKEPGDVDQCRGRAWVRAPDMVPGEVVAGDVKVRLFGPCAGAESYTLGLRYKERIFWKLRHVPLPKVPELKHNFLDLNRDMFEVRAPGTEWIPDYNEPEWMAYQESFQNKDSWSVHEEERVAFEIKTALASAEGADPLPFSFTARFGILVPNTNYPPGLDYRQGRMMMIMTHLFGHSDQISSESAYEYFVKIQFSNGTTSEIPAGMTTFVPFYHFTESDAPRVNLSLARTYPIPDSEPVDMLQSNYTIEVYFPDGTQAYQNSSVDMMAIVHRTGYTNRTDAPVELCGFLSRPNPVEWHPQELKDQSSSLTQLVTALVPSKHGLQMFPVFRNPGHVGPVFHPFFHPVLPRPCREIKFTAIPVDLTREGQIYSTSSELLSLSLYVDHDAVPDFSTYYHKLANRAVLNLEIKPDPSEPWTKNEFGRKEWEEQTADMDETDFDWLPSTLTQRRRLFYQGNTSISVIPMQKQGHLRSTPVHYLSGEARQPVFVASSDIDDLRLMSPEERDLIAPLVQPYTKVYVEGEELRNRYFTGDPSNTQEPIYVGETWADKMAAECQREMDNVNHLFVVQ